MKWFTIAFGIKIARWARSGNPTADGLRSEFQYPTSCQTALARSIAGWFALPVLIVIEILRFICALIEIDVVIAAIVTLFALAGTWMDGPTSGWIPDTTIHIPGHWPSAYPSADDKWIPDATIPLVNHYDSAGNYYDPGRFGHSTPANYWNTFHDRYAGAIWAFPALIDMLLALGLPIRLFFVIMLYLGDKEAAQKAPAPAIKPANAQPVPDAETQVRIRQLREAEEKQTDFASELDTAPANLASDPRTYTFKDGITEGPFNDEEIRLLLNGGVAILDDWAWREGMADWAPLRELYPQGGEAATVAPTIQTIDEVCLDKRDPSTHLPG